MASLSTRNLTKRAVPRFPFEKARQAVLPAWDISLAFATEREAKRLNSALRKKTYVPNVLSYAVGDRNGEIVICLAEAKKQAPSYGMSYAAFTGFLFIHGLMHLKGRRHGPTMEKEERAILARLTTITDEKAKNRNRH